METCAEEYCPTFTIAGFPPHYPPPVFFFHFKMKKYGLAESINRWPKFTWRSFGLNLKHSLHQSLPWLEAVSARIAPACCGRHSRKTQTGRWGQQGCAGPRVICRGKFSVCAQPNRRSLWKHCASPIKILSIPGWGSSDMWPVCVYIDIFNFLHCSILIVKCCFSKKFWDLFCLFFFIFSGNLSYDTSSSGCQTANAVKFTVNGKTLRWNSYLKAEKERRKTTVAMAPNNSHTHSLLMGCTSSIRTW